MQNLPLNHCTFADESLNTDHPITYSLYLHGYPAIRKISVLVLQENLESCFCGFAVNFFAETMVYMVPYVLLYMVCDSWLISEPLILGFLRILI